MSIEYYMPFFYFVKGFFPQNITFLVKGLSMDNIYYINWLKEQLRSKGLRQSEFARMAHVDPAVVSNILTGKRGPGFDTCSAFASALQMPPEIVFEAAGLMKPRDRTRDSYIKEIESIYAKFNQENKREIDRWNANSPL